jgi:hypothetical protein
VLILEMGIRPKTFATASSRSILAWYLLPPLMLVGGFYCFLRIQHTARVRAFHDQRKAEPQPAHGTIEQTKHDAATHPASEVISLEVMGLGLSLDKKRNVQVWDQISASNHNNFILPADPKAYPWSSDEKYAIYKKRSQDALAQAGDWFTENWEMPLFLVGPELRNTKCLGHLAKPMRNDQLMKEQGGDLYPLISGLTGYRMETGMDNHQFIAMQVYHSATPEQVLPDVFAFFDAHPQVPAVMVYALDSLSRRSLLRNYESDPDTVKDGYRQPDELTESMTGFVLARRDRVEAMRAFAREPAPAKPSYPWEQPHGQARPGPSFQPTEFLPKPWDQWQLIQFDRLPVLGRIHRPVTVSYVRPDGKPMKPSERQAAFAAGWKAALGTLPDGLQPARVLYDHGPANQGGRLAPLDLALHHVGPELDLNEDGINLHRCLGDLGADAAFVNVALGVYASHRRNDVSACVSLRRKDGAMILMVRPPTTGERRVPHPGGSDPLDVKGSFYGNPYWWLPEAERPKGMRVHSANRKEDY